MKEVKLKSIYTSLEGFLYLADKQHEESTGRKYKREGQWYRNVLDNCKDGRKQIVEGDMKWSIDEIEEMLSKAGYSYDEELTDSIRI